MQLSTKEVNRLSSDKAKSVKKTKAITVKLPQAQWISNGIKTWEIRANKTNHRGELVIVSSSLPKIENMMSGCAVCVVDLVDCVMVKDLPSKEWANSMLPKESRIDYRYHYAYILKNARPTIEIPVKGNVGVWNLFLYKGDLMEYPQELDHYTKLENALIMEAKLKKQATKTMTIVLVIIGLIIWGLVSLAS